MFAVHDYLGTFQIRNLYSADINVREKCGIISSIDFILLRDALLISIALADNNIRHDTLINNKSRSLKKETEGEREERRGREN